MAYKQSGWSPFTKNDNPKDKPIHKLLKGDFKGFKSDWSEFKKGYRKKNPNIIKATVPDIPIGPGGVKKAKSLFDTFSKVAKHRKKQSKLIQEMLEKKGYTFVKKKK
tara:strand:+ start:597 stop:917 length:321 start_codon:yes stop_codon:yes gene_type:complete